MCIFAVAPLVGAWIEIRTSDIMLRVYDVAPLVGAWIEINLRVLYDGADNVAPLVGAWIEICFMQTQADIDNCRSSCRSVD